MSLCACCLVIPTTMKKYCIKAVHLHVFSPTRSDHAHHVYVQNEAGLMNESMIYLKRHRLSQPLRNFGSLENVEHELLQFPYECY